MAEPHFNKLSPAEAERLALLMEECAEVQQIIGKILRHGYDSVDPVSRKSNRVLLTQEIGDLVVSQNHVISCDLQIDDCREAARRRRSSVNKYLHHNRVADMDNPDGRFSPTHGE